MYVCVCVCVFLRLGVCVMKMENALTQVLYILFSCIEHRQFKQITQMKINKSTLSLFVCGGAAVCVCVCVCVCRFVFKSH